MTAIHQWNANGERVPDPADEPDGSRREALLRTHLTNVHGLSPQTAYANALDPHDAHRNLHHAANLGTLPKADLHAHAPGWLDVCDDSGSIDCPAGPGEHTETCLDVLQAPLRKQIRDELEEALTDLAREGAHAAVWGEDHACPGIEAPHEPSDVLTGLLNMEGINNVTRGTIQVGGVTLGPDGIGYDPGRSNFCGFKVPHRAHRRPYLDLPTCYGQAGN